MWGKILIKCVSFITIFSFILKSFLFATPVLAQEKELKLANQTHLFEVNEARDTTQQQLGPAEYFLTREDLQKLGQEDDNSYGTQGSWPEFKNIDKPEYDDHLSFTFLNFSPHENGILKDIKFYHYFSAKNFDDVHPWYYKIFLQNEFDVWVEKGSINGTSQNDILSLSSFIPENQETKGLKIDFYLNRKDNTECLFTSHDYVALEVIYASNHEPVINLESPLNKTIFNLEQYSKYPVSLDLKWGIYDPDEEKLDVKLEFGVGAIKKDKSCNWNLPLNNKSFDYPSVSNGEMSQKITLSSDNNYCWQVSASDNGGVGWITNSAQFTVDLTLPSPLEKINVVPVSPSNDNSPRANGYFKFSDSDGVKADILFYNVSKGSGYFYEIARKGDQFDSLENGHIYYLNKINLINFKGSDLNKNQEVKSLKDGNYKIYGYAQDGAGNLSDPLELASLYLIDTEAPGTPIVATSFDGINIMVSWDLIEGASMYEVYRDNYLIATTFSNQIMETNLARGEIYNYWVVAVDEAGNRSLPSQKVSIYILNPQISSVSYQEPAATFIPESQKEGIGLDMQSPTTPQGQVEAETTSDLTKSTNWALVIAIILGGILILGGGLYWWYSKEEDEI